MPTFASLSKILDSVGGVVVADELDIKDHIRRFKDAQKSHHDLPIVTELPSVQFLGTCFCFHNEYFLTNRHVIIEAKKYLKACSSLRTYIYLFLPSSEGLVEILITPVATQFWVGDSHERYDIGILKIQKPAEKVFPVEFGSLESIKLTEQIGICGFPWGKDLLEDESRKFKRFGPIIHSGIISGIAPHHLNNPRERDTLLMDITVGPGMSGSPIFLANSCEVIGVQFAGSPYAESSKSTAFPVSWGIPMDKQRAMQLIKGLQLKLDHPQAEFRINLFGDFEQYRLSQSDNWKPFTDFEQDDS